MIKFSLVICTYNRQDYLRLNLEAIKAFHFEEVPFEVLVVDNNSTDGTKALVESFKEDIPGLRYVFEPNQGLSHARNRGYKEAGGEYVIYIDDDAIPYPDFMERVSFMEQNYKFDAWGGKDIPYFPEGKPGWLREDYVAVALNHKQVTPLKSREYFVGGVMVLKKNLLEELGGFDVAYGMNGKNLGYAEETELQIRMKKAGLNLGFDPALKIKHCILPHKFSVAWFYDYSFVQGKYLGKMYETKKAYLAVPGHFLIGFIQMFFLMLTNISRLLFEKEYFVENWKIDVFRKFFKRMGMIHYVLSNEL